MFIAIRQIWHFIFVIVLLLFLEGIASKNRICCIEVIILLIVLLLALVTELAVSAIPGLIFVGVAYLIDRKFQVINDSIQTDFIAPSFRYWQLRDVVH